MSDSKPVMAITGTRKGIGRFLAEHFLEQGYIVEGCSRGDSDLTHDDYRHHCLDVADEKAVISMMHAIYRSHKRLDVLINNAGIASMNHIMLTPKSQVERIFETNVYGSFLFAREAAKLMGRRKYGRIVNTATVATPLTVSYTHLTLPTNREV